MRHFSRRGLEIDGLLATNHEQIRVPDDNFGSESDGFFIALVPVFRYYPFATVRVGLGEHQPANEAGNGQQKVRR
jgi:hypothetical protein